MLNDFFQLFQIETKEMATMTIANSAECSGYQ